MYIIFISENKIVHEERYVSVNFLLLLHDFLTQGRISVDLMYWLVFLEKIINDTLKASNRPFWICRMQIHFITIVRRKNFYVSFLFDIVLREKTDNSGFA